MDEGKNIEDLQNKSQETSFGPSRLSGAKNFFIHFLKNITIEPLMFFHSFSYIMGYTLYSSYAMNKICLQGSNWFSNGNG